MKADATSFLEFLSGPGQYVVPVYQRAYSWNKKECLKLWDDILQVGNSSTSESYFIGSIVWIEDDTSDSTKPPLHVIDGQQRLTTLVLILEALARTVGDVAPIEEFTSLEIRSDYLQRPNKQGDKKYKLLLNENDRETLNAIIDDSEYPKNYSANVRNNFELFAKLMEKNSKNLEAVCLGLTKLKVIDIRLTQSQDNAQLIFESLNSKGKSLLKADLIKNFLLLGVPTSMQTELYRRYWKPIESEFGQAFYEKEFDKFIYRYLTLKMGELPKKEELYETYVELFQNQNKEVEEELAEIKKYATYFCCFTYGTEPDIELQKAFLDLRELRVETAAPLLLKLYSDFRSETITKEEFVEALLIIESYRFRIAVCNGETRSLGSTFSHIAANIDEEEYMESLKAQFLLLDDAKIFPSDENFVNALQTIDAYHFTLSKYLLFRLENHTRKEHVPREGISCEHILPQNENMREEWQYELGPDWKMIQKRCLHLLGNLTLTAYNSPLSDKSFAEKKALEGGFSMSPFKLNASVASASTWNEEAIYRRGEELANLANKIWAKPKLSSEILEEYQPKIDGSKEYSIQDHKFLSRGKVFDIFCKLQEQLNAIDDRIEEKILKYYVSYSVKQAFAFVRGRSNWVRITVNISIEQVDDPRKMCRVNKRKPASQIVLTISDEADVEYAVSILKQALELQVAATTH